MPITADSFISGHFDILRRGLDAAQERFDMWESDATRLRALLIERDKEWEKYADAQAELIDVAATTKLAELLVKVRDLERGLMNGRELVDWCNVEFGEHYAGSRSDPEPNLPERPDDLDKVLEEQETE